MRKEVEFGFRKEVAKGCVVGLELRHILRLAQAEGVRVRRAVGGWIERQRIAVVCVSDIDVDDLNALFQHRRRIAERLRRGRTEHIREAGVAVCIGNDVAVRILDVAASIAGRARCASTDHRRDILVAVKRAEATHISATLSRRVPR